MKIIFEKSSIKKLTKSLKSLKSLKIHSLDLYLSLLSISPFYHYMIITIVSYYHITIDHESTLIYSLIHILLIIQLNFDHLPHF